MKARGPETCEMQVAGGWRSAFVEDAYVKYRSAPKRCPACHGTVYVLGSYGAKQQLRLTHRRMHTGCSLTPKT